MYISVQTKIRQGDSGSEVIICFGTKFKLSVDLIQLLKVITHRLSLFDLILYVPSFFSFKGTGLPGLNQY